MAPSDAISVVIRQSLVQTRTPHDMLGRVMAVNSMFTGTSGTLGEFRAGAVRGLARRGAVGADRRHRRVSIALMWMRLFPELRGIDKLTGENRQRLPEDTLTAERRTSTGVERCYRGSIRPAEGVPRCRTNPPSG